MTNTLWEGMDLIAIPSLYPSGREVANRTLHYTELCIKRTLHWAEFLFFSRGWFAWK